MKTLDEINSTLDEFSKTYGLKDFQANQAQQTSEAWMFLKLGVLSASNASRLVAKSSSQTRATYMAELVAQVATGIMPELNAKPLDWGRDHEDAARSSYEFSTGRALVDVPFVFKDTSFREGCSPDALIPEIKSGAEIKCPWNSANYIQFFCSDKIKPEWDWQCQFQLRVTGAEVWDFVQYDPRMRKNPIKIITIERDEKKQATLEDAASNFIFDMDKMLASLGFKFGDQWRVAS